MKVPQRELRSNSVHRRRGVLTLLLSAPLALAVLLPANAMAATGDSYVALGDSYTAGPGIPSHGPPPPPPGCVKSDQNYPHLVANDLSLQLKDVSCSGAKTDDMTSPQNVTGDSQPAQFDALANDTDVVTMTIGGNDIGFTEISENCASTTPTGTPCQDHYVRGGRDEISLRIKRTADKVATVLQGIHTRSPSAAVYLVNYLPILPVDQPTWTTQNRASGHGCWPQVPITDADAAYVVAKEEELNAMLAKVAKANNATLVDGYQAAGNNHDACQKTPAQRWVEPEVAPVGAAPLHPNINGMQGYAKAVEAAINK
jgi:lysophospholipase L1-like esterase